MDWDINRALAEIGPDHRANLARHAEAAERALTPADAVWLHNRLSTMQLAMAQGWSEAKATAWLHETQRLLRDLPSDIVCWAMDEAVKASPRGFVPSVGEIRAYADPKLEDRKRIATRVRAMADHQPVERASAKPWEPAEPAGEFVTPEEAAAILDEFGLRTIVPNLSVKRGPPRQPTAADLAEIAASLPPSRPIPAELAKPTDPIGPRMEPAEQEAFIAEQEELDRYFA